MNDASFWWGVIAGAAVSAVVGTAVAWWLRTAARRRPATAATPTPDDRSTPPASDISPIPDVASLGPPRAQYVADLGPPPPPTAVRLPGEPDDATLRISYRILLHLFRHRQSTPFSGVVPEALCQAGIVAALDVPQRRITGPLKRLADSELVSVELGHVEHHDRRVKVYRLTSRGEQLARQIRTQAVGRKPDATAEAPDRWARAAAPPRRSLPTTERADIEP